MNHAILLLGASGLIGSAVAARLAARGDEVVAVTRAPWAPGLIPVYGFLHLDIADMCRPEAWLKHLSGIDGIVNCAGTLQDGPFNSTAGVHSEGIAALFAACQQVGIRRIVHISAIGVDRETPSDFSKTKLAGDRVLMECDLDWIILRPSVVFGAAAYGATALMRGLASLPMRPAFPETGPLQIIYLDDVVAAVLHFTQFDAPARRVIELVGPRTYTFDETVALLRRWLRRRPATVIQLPAAVSKLAYKAGDAISFLGWRPAVRSTAGKEIVRGAVGNPRHLQEIGLASRDIQSELARAPASVQERWFANLYLPKPIIFILLPAFWIGTGLVSLTIGWDHGMGLMREGGVSDQLAALTVVAGALADIVIGALIAWRPTTRWGLWSAIGISVAYAIIGTVLAPRLWSDPLGPMLKIWPIIALHFVGLAIREDR